MSSHVLLRLENILAEVLESLHGPHVCAGSCSCLIGLVDDSLPVSMLQLTDIFDFQGTELIQHSTYKSISCTGGINCFNGHTGYDGCSALESQQGAFLAQRDGKNGRRPVEKCLCRFFYRGFAGEQKRFFITDLEKVTGSDEGPGFADEDILLMTEEQLPVVGIKADEFRFLQKTTQI